MTRNRFITILAILIPLLIIGGVSLWFVQDKTGIAEKQAIINNEIITATTSVQNNIVDRCLQSDRVVDYIIEDNKTNSESYVTIQIKNKETEQVIREFRETLRVNYYPVESWNCGIYFIREFNYDYRTQKRTSDYSNSLWKYNYDGEGREIVDLDSYGTDFRISPDEKYVALIKSYFGKDDYALVIKSLDTTTDAFVVIANDMFQMHENVIGTFRFLDWTEDGRYFWARISQGAHVYGWIRIDIQNWSHDVYEAPEGILGGYPLDIDTGWIPAVPGAFWTGFDGDEEEIRKERQGLGQQTSSLYLYNVITKERILVHTENDPVWDGWLIKWLDQKTLEYTLLNKEKATFILPN